MAMIVPGGVDRGGTHRVVPALLALIERIARVHDLHVFTLAQEPRPDTWDLRGAMIHNIGGRHPAWRAPIAIRRRHRATPFDILHAFWAIPCGVTAALSGRLLGVPVLLHLAGGELANIPEIGYGGCRTVYGRTLARFALGGADRTTAASAMIRHSAARLGHDVSQLVLGVDTDEWPPRPPRARDPSRPARLLHVASLNAVKDQTTLIRALVILRARGIEFSVDVAGEDTLDGAVQREVSAAGMDASVRFHGFLPQRELRPLFDDADVVIVSSRHEAGPLVLAEAAVAGVPTVGTAVGQIADWAPDAAVAVAVGDAEALSSALVDVLTSDARRMRIADEAQRRALRQDANATARDVLDLYAAITERG